MIRVRESTGLVPVLLFLWGGVGLAGAFQMPMHSLCESIG